MTRSSRLGVELLPGDPVRAEDVDLKVDLDRIQIHYQISQPGIEPGTFDLLSFSFWLAKSRARGQFCECFFLGLLSLQYNPVGLFLQFVYVPALLSLDQEDR